ncbi:putative transcriptional regulator [Helicobacter phage phiHP33]|uniref:segregation and condensation complex subunit ScpB n=1 Tax=Helicobacter phage phiHP33 TaxID=1069378 RepID=UPI00023907A6|nr:segregation and condensation complex subunit ScpB [Helicobacter phage phiHP33]AET85158.1 putative transcriptional regulator [Helicobacter phage phiHP33]
MEHEKLKPIDLEVLELLSEKAYLSKTADEISRKLNIDYTYALKIFNKLEKKGLCDQWVVNKKRECDKKDNYFKVVCLNDLGKDLCAYLSALKRSKNKRKA